MDAISGIGYVVYSDSRQMFLGRMGSWSPDVRLAQVYTEPRAARMAISRLGEATLTYPVPATITVSRTHVATAKADEEVRKAKSEANGQPEPKKPDPKKPAGKAA